MIETRIKLPEGEYSLVRLDGVQAIFIEEGADVMKGKKVDLVKFTVPKDKVVNVTFDEDK
jgi:hypothetical protein